MDTDLMIRKHIESLLGPEGFQNLGELVDDLHTVDAADDAYPSLVRAVRSALDDLPQTLFVSDLDGSITTWLDVWEEPHARYERRDIARLLLGPTLALLT